MCPLPASFFPERHDASRLRFATLPEWLKWQEQLHFTAIELGLARCRRVAQRMQLLQPDFTVISVAGTNGKGSSVAMLARMLRTAGYKVGSYTSPHLLHYNERICVNGLAVSDALLCESFQRIDQARAEISLTYFEFGTLAALDIFHHAEIEIAILEVGLGGRLDAVNMLDADLSLLTSIDMDHEKWLGPDRESIGREKAGIFRPRRPAICSDPAAPASIRSSAEVIGARLYLAGRDFSYELEEGSWHWRCGEMDLSALAKPGPAHKRQVQNAAGVLMVLHELADSFPVTEEIIRAGLRDFRLAGRFQLVPAAIPYVMDVAHNPQAAAALAENLHRLPVSGKTHLVVGMLKDKNHAAVLRTLSGVADYWYLASLAGASAASASELLAVLSALGDNTHQAASYQDVVTALEAARAAASAGDRIVVTGSFVTVGAALRHLQLHE